MLKLLEVYRIGIATKYTDLPSNVATQIYMGGPGFIVDRQQSFSWGDFVVVNTDGRVSGMTKENIEIMRENSKVLNEYYNKLTAVEFADGIQKDITPYITGICKTQTGDYVRKVILLSPTDYPKSIDFELVSDVFDQRKMLLGVDQHEQLYLKPYSTEANVGVESESIIDLSLGLDPA